MNNTVNIGPVQNSHQPNPSGYHSPVIIALIIGLIVLAAVSLRQHQQLEQLRQFNEQAAQQSSRTACQLVSQLDSMNKGFEHRILEVQTDQKPMVDADAIRQRLAELDEKITHSTQQVDTIVNHFGRLEDILAKQSPGVCLLQGEYTFVDPTSGKPLRYLHPASASNPSNANRPGSPEVAIEGLGPQLAVHYTGTAFLIDKRGYLLTNRHVVEPWNITDEYRYILQAGYLPKFILCRVFFPNQPNPFPVNVVAQGDTEDVALLWADLTGVEIPVLNCQQQDDTLKIGQQVVVVGYPTGFDVLLARMEHDQMQAILGAGQVSFERVAQNLAERNLIQPTATGGLCSRVSGGRIVYDAQTAIGGSGAPVISSDGQVVAINTALLKGFSGSNFGIPIRLGLDLLNQYAGSDN